MPQRNPPPELPVRTYPSPDVAEQVLVEWVTSELANATSLEPGTPHPNQREFAGFKLGIQRVNPLDHNFTQRIWVTDESSPDAYNYALKYAFESVAHPIFIRAYRELKTAYTARVKGTALQTVYKLVLTTAGSGYTSGDTPDLTFDNTGTSGTGAAGHGVVSPTGTITELIIDNGGSGYVSAPTFTLAAPTGGVAATGTAHIQPTGAILVSEEAQSFPPESEFHALYFNVVRIYETLPGPILYGQEWDRGLDIPFPFIQQDIPANTQLGDFRKEITIIDSVKSRMRTVNPDILLLDSYIYSYPDKVNLNPYLPDVLEEVEGMIEKHQGDGEYDEDGFAALAGRGGLSLSMRGTGQASASIIPEIIVRRRPPWAPNVPSVHHVIYMLLPFTDTDVLAQLNRLLGSSGPVLDWPDFNPVEETIRGVGRSLSLQVNATAQFSISLGSGGSGLSTSEGDGYSKEAGLTFKTVRIPPTIHGLINLDGTLSDTESLTATASAIAAEPSVTASRTEMGEVVATITPTSLAATAGDTSIPTSGKRLLRTVPGAKKLGLMQLDCEVVDFSYFA